MIVAAGKDNREAKSLTPREIVEQLDRYIIGQADAKRAEGLSGKGSVAGRRIPDDRPSRTAQGHRRRLTEAIRSSGRTRAIFSLRPPSRCDVS